MKTRISVAMVCVMAVVSVSSADMVWVSINNDPGVPGHEGFTGYMSKYETTNAQYCQFLNDAKLSGDIVVTVDGSNVLGASGSNSGEDFVGQVYYDLTGPGHTQDGATNGGAARINYNGTVFSVDSGFENHPVTYVSWYGATAFCNYYGYRLPTEWEWQAVADFDGSYYYGCGLSINNSIANYTGSTHPVGTTVVGSFGDPSGYGYGMCDMAGNVWEWADSIYYSESYRVVRGGGWLHDVTHCPVSYRSHGGHPYSKSHHVGFRVVLDTVSISIDIKPGSCPNPLNVKDKGVLPVAILGSEEFDVFNIDPASIRLEGVAPIRSSYEDVSTPVPDSYLDLTLKFEVQEIVAALGEVNDGEEYELTLTGELNNGMPIEGKDCILIISKGKPE
jgi:hypothetical protein